MLGLSIRQPWAYAILKQGKDIENRSWKTPYRGKVLLHASSMRPTKAAMADWRQVCREAEVPVPDMSAGEFRLGGFMGLADVTDCVDRHESPWFFGPYGFVLANVRPLPFMPHRGQLGFFDVPEGVFSFYRVHHGITLKEPVAA